MKMGMLIISAKDRVSYSPHMEELIDLEKKLSKTIAKVQLKTDSQNKVQEWMGQILSLAL